jgi:hypothetical protein
MAVFNVSVQNVLVMWDDTVPETELVLNSYGSLEKADIYFDNRLRSTAWKESTVQERKSALVEATDLIDNLNFIGSKHAPSQFHQFPRNTDTETPWVIEKACYEIALKLLEGFDPDMETDNLSASAQGFSSVRETYDRTFVLSHLRAGIPSSKAWELLKPWLSEKRSLKIRRVD